MTVFDLDQARRRRNDGFLAGLRPVQAPHLRSQDPLPPVAIGLCKLPKAAIARSAQASRCSRSVSRLLKRRREVIRQEDRPLSLSPIVVSHIRAAPYVIRS